MLLPDDSKDNTTDPKTIDHSDHNDDGYSKLNINPKTNSTTRSKE